MIAHCDVLVQTVDVQMMALIGDGMLVCELYASLGTQTLSVPFTDIPLPGHLLLQVACHRIPHLTLDRQCRLLRHHHLYHCHAA